MESVAGGQTRIPSSRKRVWIRRTNVGCGAKTGEMERLCEEERSRKNEEENELKA